MLGEGEATMCAAQHLQRCGICKLFSDSVGMSNSMLLFFYLFFKWLKDFFFSWRKSIAKQSCQSTNQCACLCTDPNPNHLQEQLLVLVLLSRLLFFPVMFSSPDKTAVTCSSFLFWLPPLSLIGPQVARLAERQSDGSSLALRLARYRCLARLQKPSWSPAASQVWVK